MSSHSLTIVVVTGHYMIFIEKTPYRTRRRTSSQAYVYYIDLIFEIICHLDVLPEMKNFYCIIWPLSTLYTEMEAKNTINLAGCSSRCNFLPYRC